MLSFFPLGVLDEILNLIESVSGSFPSYSHVNACKCKSRKENAQKPLHSISPNDFLFNLFNQVSRRHLKTCEAICEKLLGNVLLFRALTALNVKTYRLAYDYFYISIISN